MLIEIDNIGSRTLFLLSSFLHVFEVTLHNAIPWADQCEWHEDDEESKTFRLESSLYDTVSDVVESKVHQCQQNSDA